MTIGAHRLPKSKGHFSAGDEQFDAVLSPDSRRRRSAWRAFREGDRILVRQRDGLLLHQQVFKPGSIQIAVSASFPHLRTRCRHEAFILQFCFDHGNTLLT
jgi:hypothetical protein